MHFSLSVATILLSSLALAAPIAQGPGGLEDRFGSSSRSPWSLVDGQPTAPPLASITATGPPIPAGLSPSNDIASTLDINNKGKGLVNSDGQSIAGVTASASAGSVVGPDPGRDVDASNTNDKRIFGGFVKKDVDVGSDGPPEDTGGNSTDSPFSASALLPFRSDVSASSSNAGAGGPLPSPIAAVVDNATPDTPTGAPTETAVNLDTENTLIAALESASASVTDMPAASDVPLRSPSGGSASISVGGASGSSLGLGGTDPSASPVV
ncbi:hypothetical protein I317_00412 [Kwoniella heveanensis CBS 569]|nr:hypothetical protein I317_00412 [Kwoniella heveanensis CBS 569]